MIVVCGTGRGFLLVDVNVTFAQGIPKLSSEQLLMNKVEVSLHSQPNS